VALVEVGPLTLDFHETILWLNETKNIVSLCGIRLIVVYGLWFIQKSWPFLSSNMSNYTAQTSFVKQYDAGHLGSNSTQLKVKKHKPTTHLNNYYQWLIKMCCIGNLVVFLPGSSRTEFVILFPIHAPKTNSSHLKMDGWEMILSVWERPTPWKINGWNLQPSPMKRKENDLKQTSMRTCSMLIFQGQLAVRFREGNPPSTHLPTIPQLPGHHTMPSVDTTSVVVGNKAMTRHAHMKFQKLVMIWFP